MAKGNKDRMGFSVCKGIKVEAEFVEESVTTDGGAILLREMDRQLDLSQQISKIIPEYRDSSRITHELQSMIKQRIISLALGYEDLNDQTDLRHDPAMQISAEQIAPLASASTLCRLENQSTRECCVNASKILVEEFIKSFQSPPKRLLLDFDPTDDQTHGTQEGKHYNSYYNHDCFLPLHVFCGSQLLVSYLRPSNIDGAKHVWAILALLVKRLRQAWPNIQIIFRADAGLCRDSILNWCERESVYYLAGISSNSRLIKQAKPLIARAEIDYEKTQQKTRLFDQFYYAARSWNKERKIIIKAEHGEKGQNPRFIVTNIDFPENEVPQTIYDDMYCARANMENKIKELKLDLKSGRTS